MSASGRVAVVTGASRGAGRGIAVALGAHGWRVYVTGRSIADSGTAELVSAAGGVGVMETSSADLAHTAAEFELARAATDAPLGLQMFLRVLKGQGRVDEVLELGAEPLDLVGVGEVEHVPAEDVLGA